MLFEFLIGVTIGAIVGSVVCICIDAYDSYLTSQEAKRRAEAEAQKKFAKIIVDTVTGDSIQGEVINARAFDDSNNHVADITINATKGSSLYSGQTIY